MIKGKVVAVSGSSGFVGTHLVRKLKEAGAKVVKLDIAQGTDLTVWDQVKIIEKFDLMFHLAAKIFVPDSYTNPGIFYQNNINATINALELCRIHRAKIIFASSYVYGLPEYMPIDELHPISDFNPYACSKIICEQLCTSYYRHFGVKVIILRPFNIFGPLQGDNFLIPTIIAQSNRGMVSLKDSSPRRDFLYITDTIDAYLKAARYGEKDFDIFNIGSGTSLSVKEIARKIATQFKHQVDINFTEEKRDNEIPDTIADISKAKSLLHWEPKISFIEGVKAILKHKRLIS